MTMRSALRGTFATLLVVPVLLLAGAPAAWAAHREDGDQPGPGLSAGATVLIFAGIPLAVFVVLALLTYAPSLARGPRYRPALTWFATPVWVNGPDRTPAQAALEGAGPAAATGDASPAAIGPGTAIGPSSAGGGASARW